MATAVTEAWLLAGVLRRRERLGVSGRGLRRSRRPGWARFRPGLGRPRGRAGEVRERPLLGEAGSGLVPPPQGPEDVRGGKRPLSSASPVARPIRPSGERPKGPVLGPFRRKGHGPPPSLDVSRVLPRWLGCTSYPPPPAPSWRKRASQEQTGK